jgi:sulfate transport system substrate-binding protein
MRVTRRGVLRVNAALALVLTAAGCQPLEEPNSNPARQSIIVCGFSSEEEVITEEIIPAFQMHWQEQAGQDVTFQGVFTGSDRLAEAIIGNAPVDVALLSNEQHAVWLRVNDLVETDWRTFPNEGIVTRTPLVIVVRPGNPLGITDWADLGRPGVKLIHPDPRTSGGAQWALLAEYGAALLDEEDGGRQAAQEQLRAIWSNVVATPVSSREALRQFMFGLGDAMVTYEQDALLAQSRGAALEIVVPRSTIVSEHVVVIVDKNVKQWERKAVGAFVAFLWSEKAQEAFARYYFRSVTDETLGEAVGAFHEIERPFTVEDLGGWGQAYPNIIHGVWEEQISLR